MTRVLLACDKFKGSLTAREVVEALERGVHDVAPEVDLVRVPVADGGDGTVLAALAAGFEPVPVTVSGPTGEPVPTMFALAPGLSVSELVEETQLVSVSELVGETQRSLVCELVRETQRNSVSEPVEETQQERRRAVVELADACGLVRLPGALAPLDASTRGLGEVLAAAIDAGASEIVVGIGGSASSDGGAGLLQALGARLLDARGHDIGPGVRGLESLASVDVEPARERVRDVHLTVACDVDNPLLGPRGAAAVFGPQKGLDEAGVLRADAALRHLAELVSGVRAGCAEALPDDGGGLDRELKGVDVPGAGAAGGAGWALHSVLGAVMAPGAGLVLDLVGFDEALAGADLVITGEGSFDEQTLSGKGPLGVLQRAQAAGVPVKVVCGRLALNRDALARLGLAGHVHALTDLEPDPARCMSNAFALLAQVGRQLGARLP